MVVRPKPRSTRLLVVVLVSISLAVITLDYRQGDEGPLAGLGGTAISLMAPLQRAVTNVTRPIGDFFVRPRAPAVAGRRQPALREELAALQTVRAGGEVAAGEVDRAHRPAPDHHGQPRLPVANASSSSNGVSNFENTITIDRGSADGIAVDMPVVTGGTPDRRLVGRVVDVSDVATVMLITDRDAATAARLAHGSPA